MSDPKTNRPDQLGPEGLPKQKPITFGQQFFIWSMVVIVGVLFGMGGSVPLLGSSGVKVGGIDQREVTRWQGLVDRMQNALQAPHLVPPHYDARRFSFIPFLRLAHHAEAKGLSPRGAALERLVEDFLDQPVEGGRTVRQVFSDRLGSRNEVTRKELGEWLALCQAYDALHLRFVPAPAVAPASALDALHAMVSCEADQVELSAAPLLEQVAEDDPELSKAYGEIKSRFVRPASARVMVAYGDLVQLAAQVQPSEAEIKARYERNPDAWRLPPAPAGATAPAPTHKALAEVAEEIRGALRREAAVARALELVQRFDEQLGEGRPDAAAFIAAAKAAGLAVKEGVEVLDPSAPGSAPSPERLLDLGELGKARDDLLQLFAPDKEPGFVSRPLRIESDADQGTSLILRLDSRQPQAVRSFEEVKTEVMAYVAGRRAYQRLLEEAEKVRAAAQALGPGGLAVIMATPGQARWKAQVTRTSLPLSGDVYAPPAQAGANPTEVKAVGQLALPDRPVALALADSPRRVGDLPAVRLIQVREVGSPPQGEGMSRGLVGAYRSLLREYRGIQFQLDLNRSIQQ